MDEVTQRLRRFLELEGARYRSVSYRTDGASSLMRWRGSQRSLISTRTTVAEPFTLDALRLTEYDRRVHTPEVEMARRTLSLPDSVEALVRDQAGEGESFSAAAARLIQAGARASGDRRPPRYVASGKGPRDLGRMAERYLREPVAAR